MRDIEDVSHTPKKKTSHFILYRPHHPTRCDRYAPILFTGHSLGGALAMLAAFDVTINERLPHPVQVRQKQV